MLTLWVPKKVRRHTCMCRTLRLDNPDRSHAGAATREGALGFPMRCQATPSVHTKEGSCLEHLLCKIWARANPRKEPQSVKVTSWGQARWGSVLSGDPCFSSLLLRCSSCAFWAIAGDGPLRHAFRPCPPARSDIATGFQRQLRIRRHPIIATPIRPQKYKPPVHLPPGPFPCPPLCASAKAKNGQKEHTRASRLPQRRG